jgi:hypothetical protein
LILVTLYIEGGDTSLTPPTKTFVASTMTSNKPLP